MDQPLPPSFQRRARCPRRKLTAMPWTFSTSFNFVAAAQAAQAAGRSGLNRRGDPISGTAIFGRGDRMATTAATADPGRIATLDIIRGVAVMGIFGVNVIAFAMPFQAYFNPSAYGLHSSADLGLWFATFILIDGKMRGLFSLLVGASLLLVVQRAEGSGRSPGQVHYSRMFWLLVLGCVHYYLIWFGDILT